MNRSIPLSVLMMILAVCLGAAVAGAQEKPPTDSVIRTELAHRCAGQARQALTVLPTTLPEQPPQAVVLLRQACRLDPDNAEIWRLLIEAAELADDPDQAQQALKQYLKLRPNDDVAQFRLIEQLLTSRQTLDERLAMCKRLLDSPRASRFSEALRSRLAFNLAMMQAEQGRLDAYHQRLEQALTLDATNKAAAMQAYSELVEREADLPEIAAALFTLFSADPTDPNTRAMIGDLLLGCGQYQAALDWYTTASNLQNKNGGTLSLSVLQSMVTAMWGAGKTDQALASLDQLARSLTPPDESTPESDASTPAPSDGSAAAETDKQAKPIPVGVLPIEMEAIRMMLLHQAARTEQANRVFESVIRQLQEDIEKHPENIAGQINLAWTRLLFNRELDQVEQSIAAIRKADGGEKDPRVRSLAGWLAVRRGQVERARALLADQAEDDPYSRLGLCLLEGSQIEPQKRSRWLNEVANDAPTALIGLVALDRLRAEQRQPVWKPSYRQAAALFEQVPATLKDIDRQTFSFVMLRAKLPVQRQYDYLQPITVEVELRNVSQLPMGLGVDHALPSNLMVFTTVNAPAVQGLPRIPPMVIDLHRRFRLEPGETLRVPVRLDSGSLGTLLDNIAARTVRINALFMLNPVMSRGGGLTAGVMGLRRSERGIVRQPLRINMDDLPAKVAAFAGPDTRRNLGMMSLLLKMAASVSPEEMDKAQPIIDAVVKQFGAMPEMRRAWVIAQLPPTEASRQRFESVLNAAASDSSVLVRLLLLSGQITQADSPLLNAALRSEDATVSNFAKRQKTILEAVALEVQSEPETGGEAAPGETEPVPAPDEEPGSAR